MIRGAQIKVARTLLGWSVRDLARRTGLDIADVQELESVAKVSNRRRNDVALIQAILEEVGIEFIESVGVQFRPPGLEDIAVTERARGRTGH
jgi:transcriptional regulator with XRE-family HTH domain